MTNTDILEAIGNKTVREVCELTKMLENRFGVKASDRTVVQTPMEPKIAEKVEEKTSFTVILTNKGGNSLQVIKTVRVAMCLGLKEAKDFTEKTPAVIKEDIGKTEAEELKKLFESVGATVEIK